MTGRPCEKGHYCQGGQSIQCPDGEYAPTIGMGECSTCPPGSYCDDPDGTSSPEDCPTQHYCPAGTSDPEICPDGTYTEVYQDGLESVDQCASCPTGYYCKDGEFDRGKVCNAGYYCHSGAAIENDEDMLCPRGFYCDEGSKLPTACAEGKFSEEGAESEADCVDCTAGKYCVIGVTTAYLLDCPAGHYCPAGENEPIECPKGYYNRKELREELEDCERCPAGTNCDKTGITDFNNHQCPPGYYCLEDSYQKRPCPAGKFRPGKGAIWANGKDGKGVTYGKRFTKEASCFNCPGGFYCPSEATRIPDMCEPGKYCPPDSQFPIDCEPGYYCIAGSSQQTVCPAAFFCQGGTEVMEKCTFGTYCEEGSSFETPCPDGTYGSGNVNNVDEASACIECGRGLYSTLDNPNECLDCTPGYVCLGRTNTAEPINVSASRGYECPLGHYCPQGSYEEVDCPVGRYGKKMRLTSVDDCLLCKVGTYQDEPGQEGCKKCGSTSGTGEDGGATHCTCGALGRNFVKSLGACLCSKGYRPKNEADNVDSVEDCEADVKPVCEGGHEITIDGNCLVTADDEEKYCNRFCAGGGQVVPGTGMCECLTINDADEICDAKCKKSKPVTEITSEGMLKVTNPVDGSVGEVDPSTLPGYYGEFKTSSASGAKTNNALFLDVGDDFTFGYDANEEVLAATETEDTTDRSTVVQKLVFAPGFFKDPWAGRENPGRSTLEGRRRRQLQGGADDIVAPAEAGPKKLFNPVLCMQEGDAVFFNVNSAKKQYPVYSKDSILNTNYDFDFGPFETLADMIVR